MSAYWDHSSPLAAKQEELTNALVPDSGKADTLGGEALRAANRLYYDAFNNGWCNNTSGAWNFLHSKAQLPDAAKQALLELKDKVNSGGYHDCVSVKDGHNLDIIMDAVIAFCATEDAKGPTIDMFSLQDPTYVEPENDFDPFDDDSDI
jgi:hypothetical protein